MSQPRIDSLPLELAPGLGARAKALLGSEDEFGTSSRRLSDLDELDLESGAAWSDPRFRAALIADHDRWGALEPSRANVVALGEGASCVVTGQQPGLLMGPLMCAYKILGAIALAEELSRRHGRTVVPVYWCGSDDSDFDEVRRVWLYQMGQGALRAEVERTIWSSGQRVGSVESPRFAEVERAALERLFSGAVSPLIGRVLEVLEGQHSLADRAATWALQLFGRHGLVVVDARSRPLREAGRPLFLHYAREAEALHEALEARARDLEADGRAVPLDRHARRSGLFRLEGERRTKLDPEDLHNSALEELDLAPSVLLRPVWQDALLSPVAAVLGPAELQYHAQIAPLYEGLGVRAARPVSRPHVTLWPTQAPWPGLAPSGPDWLADPKATEQVLRDAYLPHSLRDAIRQARVQASESLALVEGAIDREASVKRVRRTRREIEREFDDLERVLARDAASDAGLDPRRHAQWLSVRGVAQERALAATTWWAWWGDAAQDAMATLSSTYVEAVRTRRPTVWIMRGEGNW